jgi:hypothetical protein
MRGAAVLSVAACALLGVAVAADYEPAPVRKASEVLPAPLVAGPHFKVDDTVPSDGYMLRFKITSDYGVYEVEGRELLEVRLQEVQALAKLSEISQSDAFTKAVGQSAQNTAGAVMHVATNPVETVGAMPQGVGRFFKGLGKSAQSVGTSVGDAVSGDNGGSVTGSAEDAAKSVMGANKAKRAWAKQAQVDPYSSNKALQKKLDDLANASSAGGLAMKFVPVGIVGTIASVNSLAWDLPAEDLAKLNDKTLAGLEVSEATRKALSRNHAYTPTQATGLVSALGQLTGVVGADGAVALAVRNAKSEDDARFYRRAAEILARYQKTVGPIARLVARPTIFVGETKSGALIFPIPYDELTWTEEADTVSARPNPNGGSREVWLFGRCSERSRQELTSRGWVVRENVLAPAS